MRALFIGRFQPFHRGHLLVVQGMTKICDEIIVGIGSSKNKQDADNPLSIEERKDMIQRALQAEDIIPAFDVSFVELEDFSTDEQWIKNVLHLVGEEGTLWSGNPDTDRCFQKTAWRIQSIKEVPGISGSEIRRRILSGESWRDFVIDEVGDYLEKIGAIDRMKSMR